MGLVSTWLDGIGLASAVPTFHAAGITTPSALAELDVNHFEALGISDPNDRRKLFYLVQRIKMAVTKEASTTTKEVETMESKVDAMISGTMNIVDNAPAEGAGTSTPLRSKRSTKPKKEPSLTSALTSTTNKQKEVKKKKTPLLQSSPPIKKKKSTRKKTKKEGEDERMEEDPASSSSPKNSKPKKPKPKTTALSPTKTNEKTDTRDPSSSSSSKSSSLRVTQSPSKSTAAPSTTRTSPTPKTKSTTASPARGRPISQLRMPKASSPTHSPIRNSASKASSEELKSRLQTPKSRLRGPESKLPISSTTNQKSKMAKPRQSLLHTNTTTTAASSTTTSRQPPIDSFLQRERESPSTNLSDYTIVETTSSSSSDWPSQVEALRQDNHGEHELFCDSSSSQKQGLQEQYDMRIRVIVRKRPLSKKERSSSGSMDVIHPLDYGDFGKVLVYQPKTRVDLTKEVETVPFAYDNVFDESSNNVQIYQRSLRNLIQPFFKGQWSTVFAYGQTGSGKTYTMMGSNMTGTNAGTADSSNFGLYYLAALDIFELLQREENQHLKVTVSLFEIYAGKLFDLLHDRTPIKCLEDSKGKVCFPGLTQHAVQGPNRLMQLIQEGASNRSTGTTSRNADSSRSHAVLQLQLRKTVGRKPNVEHGRLSFIDLAGSERGADTSNCSKATRLEGAEINTSLLALKEVIRALATGGSMTHIPFRGSKLTQVLKDSFVGEQSRCCMVACISPDSTNCEQTLNTLRYADRVKERNNDSGALPSTCEQPVRLPSNSYVDDDPVILETRHLSDDEKRYSDDGCTNSSTPTNASNLSSDTNMLDGLLATPAISKRKQRPSVKQQAGQDLIAAHRSIMSAMLTMVKKEMILVNQADGDRQMQDYLKEVETLQSTQLSLISQLRGALNTYVAAAETGGSPPPAEYDSDFEDLRD